MKNRLFLVIYILLTLNACSTSSSTNWMQVNKENIDKKNITQIALPGSYLANAYKINGSEEVCYGETIPDIKSANANLKEYLLSNNQFNIKNFINHLNTQKYDISEQLSQGIRYLEIQVCQQHKNYYTSNYFLTDKLSKINNQIIQFINKYPEEIIIIDFNYYLWTENGYMNAIEIKNFHDFLEQQLGSYLIPKNLNNLTIGEIKKRKERIIILSSSKDLNQFDNIWDKNTTAITIPNDFSAIKKISTLQMVQEQFKNNSYQNKFVILPVYELLPINDLISTENKVNNNMVLNYIQRSISSNASIIVLDKNSTNSALLKSF